MLVFSPCQLYFMLTIVTSQLGYTLGERLRAYLDSKLTHEKQCEQVYELEADIRGEGRGRKVEKDCDRTRERSRERWRQTARGCRILTS